MSKRFKESELPERFYSGNGTAGEVLWVERGGKFYRIDTGEEVAVETLSLKEFLEKFLTTS